MLPNFIAKLTVERRYCLHRNGRLAIEDFVALREHVIDLASREAAALFAEPILTSRADLIDVAYYGEPVGEAVPIDRLDAAARGVVVERLRARLAALAPLLSSSLGPLLAQALYVTSSDDVLAIGSEPLLIRWGMLPADVAAGDRAALDAHFAATIGRYAPFGGPRLESPRTSGLDDAPSEPYRLPPSPPAGKVWHWPGESRGLVIATVVSAVAALLLALPGILATPATGAATAADLLPAARQISRAMQDKIDQARKALTGVICDADGSIKPGAGDGQQGQLPPSPISVTPSTAGAQGDMSLVARRATESVVLLMNCIDRSTWEEAHRADKDKLSPIDCSRPGLAGASPGAENLVLDSSGSGFFIGPKLVVTNTHVVAGAKRMFASSAFLGRVVPGKVEAATVKVELSDADFAVVSLDTDTSPPPIPLSASVSPLQNVVAAGFPGIVIDPEQFAHLLKGDFSAMPDMTTFPGFVTLLPHDRGAVPLIYSSAAIAHGNSGGPLLDLCARAVGINTLGGSGRDQETSYAINIAEGSSALIAFLDQHHFAHQAPTEACGPGPQAAKSPPPPDAIPPPPLSGTPPAAPVPPAPPAPTPDAPAAKPAAHSAPRP